MVGSKQMGAIIVRFMLFFCVSLLASVVGAICGIGGGVIIKPALDLFQLASVSTISFLSGCTVLSMSCYSVAKSMRAGDGTLDLRVATPLGIGAAVGGIVGHQLFSYVKSLFADANMVGAIQALCLLAMTLGTLIYTLRKARIRTRQVQSPAVCVCIGLALGVMSSFLGIGGGPVNLVVLGHFFSMDTRTAAKNSLYIILLSQAANLLSTLLSGSIPEFEPLALVLMVAGGIGGGIIGRKLSSKMDSATVDKLFIGLMVVIMGISLFNAVHYAMAA